MKPWLRRSSAWSCCRGANTSCCRPGPTRTPPMRLGVWDLARAAFKCLFGRTWMACCRSQARVQAQSLLSSQAFAKFARCRFTATTRRPQASADQEGNRSPESRSHRFAFCENLRGGGRCGLLSHEHRTVGNAAVP